MLMRGEGRRGQGIPHPAEEAHAGSFGFLFPSIAMMSSFEKSGHEDGAVGSNTYTLLLGLELAVEVVAEVVADTLRRKAKVRGWTP